MKRFCVVVLVLYGVVLSTALYAIDLSLFPNDSLSDLTLIETDTERSEFVMMNKEGEETNGSIGDIVGREKAKVIEIHELFVVVETRKVVIDSYGWERERVNHMRLSLAYGFEGKGIQ